MLSSWSVLVCFVYVRCLVIGPWRDKNTCHRFQKHKLDAAGQHYMKSLELRLRYPLEKDDCPLNPSPAEQLMKKKTEAEKW